MTADPKDPTAEQPPAGAATPDDQKSEDDLVAEWESMAQDDGNEAAGGGEAAAGAAASADASGQAEEEGIPAIQQVEVDAYAILGTATMPVSQLLRMGRGAVVELTTTIGDQIELRINNQAVAKGEVVVVEDRIAVEITEIMKRGGK